MLIDFIVSEIRPPPKKLPQWRHKSCDFGPPLPVCISERFQATDLKSGLCTKLFLGFFVTMKRTDYDAWRANQRQHVQKKNKINNRKRIFENVRNCYWYHGILRPVSSPHSTKRPLPPLSDAQSTRKVSCCEPHRRSSFCSHFANGCAKCHPPLMQLIICSMDRNCTTNKRTKTKPQKVTDGSQWKCPYILHANDSLTRRSTLFYLLSTEFVGRRGGLMVSALDSGSGGPGSSPDRGTALCSWARYFTLIVPLSTQVYKWVPANLLLGVTPSRGE